MTKPKSFGAKARTIIEDHNILLRGIAELLLDANDCLIPLEHSRVRDAQKAISTAMRHNNRLLQSNYQILKDDLQAAEDLTNPYIIQAEENR